MQRFFRVTPPSVHQMVLWLEKAGLITRQPGIARSRKKRLRTISLFSLGQTCDPTPKDSIWAAEAVVGRVG